MIAALVAQLTGSTVWVGGLATVLLLSSALPQIVVARLIEPRPRKMRWLLLAIYLRVASWAALALLLFLLGAHHPHLVAWLLIALLVVFSAGGGLGGVPYTDIIGKVIPKQRRGAFFGGKEALAAPLALGGALLVKPILGGLAYPANYALLFALAAAALLVASLGFLVIREPPSPTPHRAARSWRLYRRQLAQTARILRVLVAVQILTGFSMMVLPFYVVYANTILHAPLSAVGLFVVAQVSGSVVANLLWARLVDRHGSRAMIATCAALSASVPLMALASHWLGWHAMLAVFALAGASLGGRRVGFQSALLELAPAAERPTYAALNATLILPIAVLPLLAGLFLRSGSYVPVFLLSSGVVTIGALLTWRLPRRATPSAA